MKKLLIVATLSITVAAVIKRVAEKNKSVQVKLNLGGKEYKSFAKNILEADVIKPEHIKVDENTFDKLMNRSAFVQSLSALNIQKPE